MKCIETWVGAKVSDVIPTNANVSAGHTIVPETPFFAGCHLTSPTHWLAKCKCFFVVAVSLIGIGGIAGRQRREVGGWHRSSEFLTDPSEHSRGMCPGKGRPDRRLCCQVDRGEHRRTHSGPLRSE